MNEFPPNVLADLVRRVGDLTMENEQLRFALLVVYDAICATMGWIDAFEGDPIEFDENCYLKLADAVRQIQAVHNKGS